MTVTASEIETTATAAGKRNSSPRAAFAARAALNVGDAIAQSHETSLREARPGTPENEWIRERLAHEVECARTFLREVLSARLDDAEQLAEVLQLCRIWRHRDDEFAVTEQVVIHELRTRHGISLTDPIKSAHERTQMKNRLLILPLIIALLAPLSACSSMETAAPTPSKAAAAEALTGEWRMISLETGGEGSYITVPYSGQIDFDADTVSVQAMNPDTSAPDTAYTVNGYEAFYGDLSVDAGAGTFSVQVESALARDLIGQTLTRNYEVTADTLVLTPIDPAEGWRVTYERHAD